MTSPAAPAATPVAEQLPDTLTDADLPWLCICWDDPVNLMSYVVRVFRRYFGYAAEHATALMLAVHNEGHAVVATGPRETMEVHAQAMHDFGLWATIRRVPQ